MSPPGRPRVLGRRSLITFRRALAPSLAALSVAVVAIGGQSGQSASSQSTVARGDELRRTICTGCHKLPPPDVLPKARWPTTVRQMFLRLNDRPEPTGPDLERVVLPDDFAAIAAYYEAQAPDQLPPPEPWPPAGEGSPRFRKHELVALDRARPTVSNVRFADLEGDGRLELIVCDMGRYGLVMLGRPYDPANPLTVIGDVPTPAHAEVVDLNRDGVKDLLVADLGELLPSDHLRGGVAWFRGKPGGGYSVMELDGFPRVADAEAADVDGDGDLDLIVGAFGWRKVGHVAVLVNETTDWARPQFKPQVIDPRAGAIAVPPVDLNGDGRIDLVALLAQQHESVVAYYNDAPRPGFRIETLYAAPHPNWGSTGMQLADLDGDGDLDVLLAHGDTLDDFIVKPYHGIQWLENTGGWALQEHTLATLPGVQRAIAADLDGDGDQDVVAASLIAFDIGGAEKTLASIVWLEQVARGRFERHTLEMGAPRHATIDAADYDLDGDVDIAVGNLTDSAGPLVTVWENRGRDEFK